MKEKKQWKKSVVSLLMAFAMVITQIGVWNAGKESVQAAETEMSETTLYFQYNGEKELAIGYTSKNDTYGSSGWLWEYKTKWINYYNLEKVENSNWYKTIVLYNKQNMGENWVSLSICEISKSGEDYVVDSVLATYNNSENLDAYKAMFDGTYSDPAILANDYSKVVSYRKIISSSGDLNNNADKIIKNGDFEDGTNNWTIEGISESNYAVKTSDGYTSNDLEMWSGDKDIDFSFSQDVTIPAGTYTLSVVSAGNAQQATIRIGELCTLIPAYSDYGKIISTTSKKFTVSDAVTVNVSIKGKLNANWNPGFYLDNIVLNKMETADKSKLEALMKKVPVSLTEFETTSAEKVKAALDDATECTNNDSATAVDIDACYTALETALSSLIYSDDEIQIEKVSGLNDRTDFIKGIDISTYLVETASGVKYKDQSGKYVDGKDFIRTFAQNGVNYIRLRVWNQPYDVDGAGNKLYYGGGNNDIDMAVNICKLIKEYNDTYANTYGEVKVLIDLHYSDFWADPDKQTTPKAWKNMNIATKTSAVKEFTKDCLKKVEATGVTVGMLQIGNETNNGICGEKYGTDNYLAIFRAGCDAVKEYNESKGYTKENGNWIKRVVHFTDPHSAGTSFAAYLKSGNIGADTAQTVGANGVDYDVYATSYYPYWHGTTANLNKMLKDIADKCNCEVMVAETQYVYTNADYDGADNQAYEGKNNIELSQWPVSVQGQANEIRDVIDAVAQVGDKGIGMFYWEPAWLGVGNAYNEDGTTNEAALTANKQKWNKYGSGWASDYAGTYDEQANKWGGGGTNNENASLFDFDGNPLASFNVFKYVNYGSVAKNKSFYATDELKDLVVKMGDSKATIKDALATEVGYRTNDEAGNSTSTKKAKITWDDKSLESVVTEISTTKAIGNDYTVSGTIDVDGQKYTVTCKLLVDPSENLLQNGSFEDEIGDEWKYTNGKLLWQAFASENKDANTRNESKGSVILNSYHVDENSMIADENGCYADSIAQTLSLPAGVYEAKAFFEGLDKAGSNPGESIHLSVVDGNGTEKISNSVTLDGWQVWQCATVGNITITNAMVAEGKNTVTVSANVCMKKDVWGSIDDVYLYKVGDVTDSGNSGSSTVTPSTPSTDTPASDKKDDKSEVTTEDKKVTATTSSGEKIEATVSVSKDKDGNVTEATATVTGTKAKLSAEVAAEIAKAAGTDSVAITASVTDKNGKEKYTVTVDSKNLTANKKLQVVAIDPKTGEYKLVNAKTYKVGKDGTLDVNLAAGADYKLMTPAEVKAVEKAILKTVEVKNPSVSVKKGKKTKLQLSDELDMDNVKNITYKTGKKSVATVSKSGKITAKKKGTVTIKAIVTLKNGKKKTVSMKLSIR